MAVTVVVAVAAVVAVVVSVVVAVVVALMVLWLWLCLCGASLIGVFLIYECFALGGVRCYSIRVVLFPSLPVRNVRC